MLARVSGGCATTVLALSRRRQRRCSPKTTTTTVAATIATAYSPVVARAVVVSDGASTSPEMRGSLLLTRLVSRRVARRRA